MLGAAAARRSARRSARPTARPSRGASWRRSSPACRRPWPASTATRSRSARDAGRLIGWKTAASLRADRQPVVDHGALGHARRARSGGAAWTSSRRRRSAAPDRAREARRAPDRHGDRGARRSALGVLLAGDVRDAAGRRDPARGGRRVRPWVGVVALAFGSRRVRPVAVPRSRRGRRRSPAPSCSSATSRTATASRARVRADRQPDLVRLDGHHQPLGGEYDWLSLLPARSLAVALFAVGVVAFARRDLGRDHPHPVAQHARRRARARRAARALARRAAAAAPSGGGSASACWASCSAAAATSFSATLEKLPPEMAAISSRRFPNIDLRGRRGRSSSSRSSQFALILAGSPRRRWSAAGPRTRPRAGWSCCSSTPMSRVRWAVRAASGCSPRSGCSR